MISLRSPGPEQKSLPRYWEARLSSVHRQLGNTQTFCRRCSGEKFKQTNFKRKKSVDPHIIEKLYPNNEEFIMRRQSFLIDNFLSTTRFINHYYFNSQVAYKYCLLKQGVFIINLPNAIVKLPIISDRLLDFQRSIVRELSQLCQL